MLHSGLTSAVIDRTETGDGRTRITDAQRLTDVGQFLAVEAMLLDEWRLEEWLALFDPAAHYTIPTPEDLSDDPATTLHLVHDSMTTLAGRIGRLKSKHAHAESPRSRTRRQITNVLAWEGPGEVFSRCVFGVTRVRGGAVDRYSGVYEHLLRPEPGSDAGFAILRRRVLIDHSIEAAGGQLSVLL
jgi:p-cumate 2,3-dioxygenase beta subunit